MKHSLYEKQIYFHLKKLNDLRIILGIIFIFSYVSSAQAKIYPLYEWAKENFKQADRHDEDYTKAAREYVRKVSAYNYMTIEAEFSTMLLSDPARMLYVDYYGKNHGFSPEQAKLLKQRQLAENKNFISVYVVAWKRDRDYISSKSLFTGQGLKTGNILKGEDALWNVSLIVGGKRYQPETVRLVEMPLEYQMFFGEHLNLFSTVYLVRFSAKDKDGNYIFPEDKCSAVIEFNSPRYRVKTVYKGINFYLK